jgi:hypothetical protein
MAFPTGPAKRFQIVIAALAMVFVMAGAARAQWLSLPLPGTPRTPDGKPNLAAPAPKTPDGKPDLSGIWHAEDNRYVDNIAGERVDIPMLPSAAALYKHRQETLGADKPQLHCMPHGVPDAMLVSGLPFKIVQTPRETIVLFEEFNQYRQIFTDGRKLPEDPNPAWLGYSVAKWEGDTFVTDVAGFKEGTWLDNGGHPHTDALHLTERYRRPNFGNLELEVAVNDPGSYPKPWKSATIHFKLLPDTELLEHLCENEKDAEHLQISSGKQ